MHSISSTQHITAAAAGVVLALTISPWFFLLAGVALTAWAIGFIAWII